MAVLAGGRRRHGRDRIELWLIKGRLAGGGRDGAHRRLRIHLWVYLSATISREGGEL